MKEVFIRFLKQKRAYPKYCAALMSCYQKTFDEVLGSLHGDYDLAISILVKDSRDKGYWHDMDIQWRRYLDTYKNGIEL